MTQIHFRYRVAFAGRRRLRRRLDFRFAGGRRGGLGRRGLGGSRRRRRVVGAGEGQRSRRGDDDRRRRLERRREQSRDTAEQAHCEPTTLAGRTLTTSGLIDFR